MAARTKLTQQKHKDIVAAARAGVPRGVAVRAARVDMSTFQRWLRLGERLANGRKPKNEYEQAVLELYMDVMSADAECERWAVSKVARAIEDGDIATTRWFLERRFAKHWLPKQQIGVARDATDPKQPLEIEFVLATPKKPVPEDSFEEPTDETEAR